MQPAPLKGQRIGLASLALTQTMAPAASAKSKIRIQNLRDQSACIDRLGRNRNKDRLARTDLGPEIERVVQADHSHDSLSGRAIRK